MQEKHLFKRTLLTYFVLLEQKWILKVCNLDQVGLYIKWCRFLFSENSQVKNLP